jgi:16S rRNA (guanine527-N7)-methyltransferase
MTEEKADSGPVEEPSEPGEPSEAEAKGAAAPEAAPKSRKDIDPDAELQYTDLPAASLDELRAALDWAFEGEAAEPELLDRFARHAELVLQGNQRMNLTAIVDPKEVAAKHFLDSWRITTLWPLMGRKVLDLGTGAGFPGLPVAMGEPMARVTLIDSTKKRIDFVEACVDELGVKNASTEWGRAEEYLARNEVDIVLVRALSSVRENVRLLRKVRHSHKDLIMLKGPSWSREMRAAEREAERLGFHLDTVLEYELPEEMGKRAILVYRAPGGAGI